MFERPIKTPAVARFAAFKYKPGTTNAQQRRALDGLIDLDDENKDLVNDGPRGDRNNNPEGFGRDFNVLLTVQFNIYFNSNVI